MNTLNWGLQRARQKYSIRHTEKIREHVHQARRVLDLSIDYYRQSKHAGDELASERFSEAQLRRVLDELYPSGTDDAATHRTRRSREQTKERIIDCSPTARPRATPLAPSGPPSTRSSSTPTGSDQLALARSASHA